jgi:hypothetical protein
LEHAVLVLRGDRPLRFHCCWLRDILLVISTRARRIPANVERGRMRRSIYPCTVSWNLL